jgi:hypothetical protein
MKRITLLAFGLLLSHFIFAAYVENVPQTIRQPDGKIFHCLASGDEYYHWLHDANGYTIVMNPVDGYFYYGIRSGETIVPSKFKVGMADPAIAGLEIGVKISERSLCRTPASFRRSAEIGSGNTN